MDKSVVDSPDQPSAEITIPDGNSVEQALGRTTHLGIGAHQDDLEFMAMQGIGECFDSIEKWFGGVICTHGGGSVRQGEFAGLSDAELQEVRAKEQREAARMGKYSFVTQLAYGSSEIKDPETNVLEDELLKILERTHPEVVYTHNLADKHPTHIAVTAEGTSGTSDRLRSVA